MAQVQNKENMTISIREYTDNQGQTKKVWKTIGELITWDDGSKSFELWGPGGHVKGNVFEKQDNNQQQAPQPNQQQGFQQQQGVAPPQSFQQNKGNASSFNQQPPNRN